VSAGNCTANGAVAGARLTDWVPLGVLAAFVSWDAVADAVGFGFGFARAGAVDLGRPAFPKVRVVTASGAPRTR
jgi:hypothetical protein